MFIDIPRDMTKRFIFFKHNRNRFGSGDRAQC
jgi:hypothetical protein